MSKFGFQNTCIFQNIVDFGPKKARRGQILGLTPLKVLHSYLHFSKEHFEPRLSTLRALIKKLGFKSHVFLIFSTFDPIFDRIPLGRLVRFGPTNPKMLPDLFFRSH